jgi:DNA-binding LacI/PurR family transcriptional regulator
MPKRNANDGSTSVARPVSLKTLAEHLGLSTATISAVVNDTPKGRQFPQSTRDLILKAAKEFDYRPNYLARSLRQRRTHTAAVIVQEISEGYAASILSSIERRLVQEGYLYFVAAHRGDARLIDDYPRLLLQRAVEGFILVNTPLRRELPVPVVSIAAGSQVKGNTRILLDNARGCQLALAHLASRGHREIAFFKGHPRSGDTQPRWEGICRAAQELGLVVRPELTVQLHGLSGDSEPSTPEEGYEYARQLLQRKKPFTALFAFNDISAIGAISALRDAGLRVPQDVSVVGFDDIRSAAFQNPRLTTVRQPLEQMGELAASILLQRIADPENAPEAITVEPELMVRESTSEVLTQAATRS